MKDRALFAVLSVLFLASFSATQAQVWTPPPPPKIDMQNQIWRTFRMGQIGNQMAADLARSRASNPRASQKPASGNPNRSVFQEKFAFQRTARSPLALKMAANSPADAVKFQQMIDFAWEKFQQSFEDENRRLGMPFNDIASAMTYYIVGGYLYANDLSTVQSEHSVAVYKQIAQVFGNDPEFAKLGADEKQMLGDLLVTMGGLPVFAFEQNRDKNAQMSAGRANLERLFGQNASKLRITENGVEF